MATVIPILQSEGNANGYDVTEYRGTVTFGSTSIASQVGNPVVWARTGAGAYTLTLPCPYSKYLGFIATLSTADGVATYSAGLPPAGNTISTTGVAIITIKVASSGTATDPATGDVLSWQLCVSNSALNVSV